MRFSEQVRRKYISSKPGKYLPVPSTYLPYLLYLLTYLLTEQDRQLRKVLRFDNSGSSRSVRLKELLGSIKSDSIRY